MVERNWIEVIEIILDKNCGEGGIKNECMEEKVKNDEKDWKIDERRRREENEKWEWME